MYWGLRINLIWRWAVVDTNKYYRLGIPSYSPQDHQHWDRLRDWKSSAPSMGCVTKNMCDLFFLQCLQTPAHFYSVSNTRRCLIAYLASIFVDGWKENEASALTSMRGSQTAMLCASTMLQFFIKVKNTWKISASSLLTCKEGRRINCFVNGIFAKLALLSRQCIAVVAPHRQKCAHGRMLFQEYKPGLQNVKTPVKDFEEDTLSICSSYSYCVISV